MEKELKNAYSAFFGSEDEKQSSSDAYSQPELTASGYARADEQRLFAELCSKYDSLNLTQSYATFKTTNAYGSFSSEEKKSPSPYAAVNFSAIRMYEVHANDYNHKKIIIIIIMIIYPPIERFLCSPLLLLLLIIFFCDSSLLQTRILPTPLQIYLQYQQIKVSFFPSLPLFFSLLLRFRIQSL